MANDSNNETRQSLFVYRLTLGDSIKSSGGKSSKLPIEQEIRKSCNSDGGTYTITLHKVNVKKKIYQPCEIIAEMDLEKEQKEASGTVKTVAPSFKDAQDLFLKRLVKLELVVANTMEEVNGTDDHSTVYTIAENYYVHALNPQLRRLTSGTTVMSVKLNIYSLDMLMTLNKYSKAYVARKLGSGILKPESLCFGKKDDKALIPTNIKGMRFLKYDESVTFTDSHGTTTSACIPSEFIQPYLVQYNESFYDFLVRTANRCGEFLYFEDGELTLGLPDSGDPMMIDDFESVTLQSVTPPPLDIPVYARDSAKEGKGPLKHMNYTAIDKDDSYPKNVFPENTSYNSEIATDEYIYPLYKGKATDLEREMMYDGGWNAGILKTVNVIKNAAASTKEKAKLFVDAAVVKYGVVESVKTALTAIEEHAVNEKLKKTFFNPMKGNKEQCNGDKLVQFGTLSEDGWTTVNYYSDVRKQEEKQMQEIICINMNTNFYPLKLGQKIAIPGTDNTYVVTEIETGRTGEQRWMKVFAIPSYKDKNEHECFVPPVQPVSIIRKSGPQTAFIVASNDPKYQGRVRITYPWQSLGSQVQERLDEATAALEEAEQRQKSAKERTMQLKKEHQLLITELEEMKEWPNMTAAKREARKKELEDEISKLEESIRNHEDAIDKAIKAVDDKEAEIEKLPKETENREARLRELEEDRQVLIIQKADAINEHRPKIAEEEEALARKKAYLAKLTELEDNSKRDTILNEKNDELKETTILLMDSEKQKMAEDKKVEEKKDAKEKAEDDKEKKLQSIATPWIRVATPVATEGGGFYYEPNEGDEVLVNYDNDNVERPYVVGQLYSKENLDPRERMNRKQSPRGMGSMALVSRNGHHISFSDPSDGAGAVGAVAPALGVISKVTKWGAKIPIVSEAMMKVIAPKQLKDLTGGIHIGDRYGLYEISMSSDGRKININSPLGQVNLNAFTGISIKAVNGDINIEGKNVSIKAGNKLTIESGTNIGLGPSMGSIDYEWSKHYVSSALHAFGHEVLVAALDAVPKEVFKEFPITDLSLIRNMTQVFLRPVNGTMLIKSHKYMLLEAGRGQAMVKADRFKEVTGDDYFLVYKTMIFCVGEIQNRLQQFFDVYKDLWTKACTKRKNYFDETNGILKNREEPNIRTLAAQVRATSDWDDTQKQAITNAFTDKVFKNGVIPDRKEVLKAKALECGAAAYNLQKHVVNFSEVFSDVKKYHDQHGHINDPGANPAAPDYAEWVLKVLLDVFEAMRPTILNDWATHYGLLNGTPKETFLGSADSDDRFLTNQTEIMREMAAKFVLGVSQDDNNKNNKKHNKYIYIGYDEKDIFRYGHQKLKQKFYWTRFIKNMDRYIQNSNAWRVFLMSWVDSYWNKIRDPEKWKRGKEIWDKEKHGQILMSDNPEYTLNLDNDGVKSEDTANLYSLDKLKRKLYEVQYNR
jgi:hypothetical protein